MMNLDAVRRRLEAVEGRVNHFYLDTKGVPTIGVGHAVPTAGHAVLLPWPAGLPKESVIREYQRLRGLPIGKPAEWYATWTALRLPDAAIDGLRDSDIEETVARLGVVLPEFAGWPATVQEALLDIAFNCGVVGLLRFPHMLAACRAGNWELAASESGRPDCSNARNAEIAGLFHAARTIEA